MTGGPPGEPAPSPGAAFPPPGVNLPIFDTADLKLIGWDAGMSGSNFVMQTGPCWDHSAIIFSPGARIVFHDDGHLEMQGVTWQGGRPVEHDPRCPTASGPAN